MYLLLINHIIEYPKRDYSLSIHLYFKLNNGKARRKDVTETDSNAFTIIVYIIVDTSLQ